MTTPPVSLASRRTPKLQLATYVEPETHTAFLALADREERSVSQLLRRIVERELEKEAA